MCALSICSMLPSRGSPGGPGRSSISRRRVAAVAAAGSVWTVMPAPWLISLLRRRRDLVAHQPAVLALPVALLLGVALVVLGLALGERDLGLDPAPLVMQVERHQRESLLLDLA